MAMLALEALHQRLSKRYDQDVVQETLILLWRKHQAGELDTDKPQFQIYAERCASIIARSACFRRRYGQYRTELHDYEQPVTVDYAGRIDLQRVLKTRVGQLLVAALIQKRGTVSARSTRIHKLRVRLRKELKLADGKLREWGAAQPSPRPISLRSMENEN